MPRVQFESREDAIRGLYFLVTHGEVACRPNNIYIISDWLLSDLEKSGIPFRLLSGRINHDGARKRSKSRHE
ncbi:hypothetical protein FJZ31_24655 [Candidatus Poribacteria bacterium]|nr:hypothetical protein [Candidatus Poribacteria bacterium]